MAAQGYLFLMCVSPAKRQDGGTRRQGAISGILGKRWTTPAAPAAKIELTGNRSPEEMTGWLPLFVRGMTQLHYNKFAERLIRKCLSKADLLALVTDEDARNKIRKGFTNGVRVRHADVLTIDFADLRALFKDNDTDAPVELED